MAKTDDVGLKQLKNGNWSCRIYKKINGVQIDTTCRIDERTGAPFKTKTQARNYRNYKIELLRNPENIPKKETAVKFSKIWEYYLNEDSKGKAKGTITKYTSVWENHLKSAFGNKFISGDQMVSVQEINNYLADLYYSTDLSYGYIQGFLRLFYCLYGNAYRRNIINLETLTKYTKDKARITMPPKTQQDEEEEGKIEIYTQGQIAEISSVFKGTDLEPAFLIAIYCGLRESEIFGLMWDDIDFNNNTITVNKQLLRINDIWAITKVKTLTSSRIVEMPAELVNFLIERKKLINREKVNKGFKSRSNEIVEDLRGKAPVDMVGADFVNRKLFDGLSGKLLTVNSIKAYSKKIKLLFGYSLKMHKLRKTHLSFLASHGYPLKSLMERAGHKKIETTMRYYIEQDETMKAQATRIINTITLNDPEIEVDFINPLNGKTEKMKVKQSEILKINNK